MINFVFFVNRKRNRKKSLRAARRFMKENYPHVIVFIWDKPGELPLQVKSDKSRFIPKRSNVLLHEDNNGSNHD